MVDQWDYTEHINLHVSAVIDVQWTICSSFHEDDVVDCRDCKHESKISFAICWDLACQSKCKLPCCSWIISCNSNQMSTRRLDGCPLEGWTVGRYSTSILVRSGRIGIDSMFVFSVYVCTGEQTGGNGEVVYLLMLAGIMLHHKDCSTFGVAAAKVLSSSV